MVPLEGSVIGDVSLKFNLARFSRTLGSLLSSGVSILEALDIVSKSTRTLSLPQK
jgi:type II secretory pathway component PulF